MDARNRPVGVTIIAIVNIIFGLLGLLGTMGGAITTMSVIADPPAAAKEPHHPADFAGNTKTLTAMMMEKIPHYKMYFIGSTAAGFLVTILEVLSGVGLLKMKPWARTACLVFATLAIVSAIVDGVYTATYLMPIMEEWQRKSLQNSPAAASVASGVTYVAVFFGLGLRAVYGIIIWLYLGRPSIGQLFRGHGSVDKVPAEPE